MENKFISISNGNSKMGAIPSVSLPPVLTCRNGAPCAKQCYALKLYKLRPSVKNAYDRNLSIYQSSPAEYFAQLSAAMRFTCYFRVHVSGDIPTADYFARLVDVVRENAHCKVLMFTKQYEIVNAYIQNGGTIPDNFKIIFSAWGAWRCENPYNFPETNVIFRDTIVPDEWKICGGNCQECACRGVGCWQLQKGDILGFKKH